MNNHDPFHAEEVSRLQKNCAFCDMPLFVYKYIYINVFMDIKKIIKFKYIQRHEVHVRRKQILSEYSYSI